VVTTSTLTRAAVPTTDVVLDGARALILLHGFHGFGFGDDKLGYSLEGAIYAALGFHLDNFSLKDPELGLDCPMWQASNRAMRAIARQLGESRSNRAFATVCDWSEQGTQHRAIRLLEAVAAAQRTAYAQAAA
jgi:hypothetical protein